MKSRRQDWEAVLARSASFSSSAGKTVFTRERSVRRASSSMPSENKAGTLRALIRGARRWRCSWVEEKDSDIIAAWIFYCRCGLYS